MNILKTELYIKRAAAIKKFYKSNIYILLTLKDIF